MIPLFSMLQLEVVEGSPQAFDFAALAASPLVILGIVLAIVVLLAIAAVAIVRKVLHGKVKVKHTFDTVVLRVRVPKEVKQEDVEHTKSLQQMQELIGFTETIFQTIGSLKAQRGFNAWLHGRNDTYAFEVVANKSLIVFYVACPANQRQFLESQIQAQYPYATIDDTGDYDIFTPSGTILTSHLKFKRPSYFPIKTYKKMETDPMNVLTNALSKIEDKDGAAIQFLIRSAPASWRREGIRIARAMQQGKKYSEVSGSAFWRTAKETFGTVSGPKENAQPKEAYRLSPMEEEMVKGFEEKASKAGLEVNIRVVTSAPNQATAKRYLDDIVNAFGQYNIFEFGNSLNPVTPSNNDKVISYFIHRHFDQDFSMVMNSEEIASMYHFPLASTETPKIDWLLSRKSLPPSNLPREGILLGLSEYRGHAYEIRMKAEDRRRHMYIIGKSGGGKTVLLTSMIKQDIENGAGVCVIDPHGDLAEECLELVPRERAEDVIFFNPADVERPMGLNMIEFDPRYPEQKTFAVNELLKIFDQLYDLKSTGGPMFEQYMRNALLLIMEDPASGSTLMEVSKVLADEDYRRYKLSKCKSSNVHDFWVKEAQKAGGEASLANMVPYITSKMTPFIANDFIRPVIAQQKSAFNVREAMDSGKILLVALNKGKIGDINAFLIGMIVVGKILMAALSRGDMDPKKRKDFYLYIDEFQNFLTDSISAILSEARKYGLNLIIVHQFISQLTRKGGDTQIRDAIFGNVGTMAAFRIGADDAEFLEKEYQPILSRYDLMNTEAFTVSIKMLIDNTASKGFNMKTVMPKRGDRELANMIKELSRYKYGRKRELVEAELAERYTVIDQMIRNEAEAKGGEKSFDF